MNRIPGTVVTNTLPGLSESTHYQNNGIFLNMRSLNYSSAAVVPIGDAVFREIQDCLQENQEPINGYRFRCAKLFDNDGEIRVAYGTAKQEVEREQLCWGQSEHLGMLVCRCNSLARLY